MKKLYPHQQTAVDNVNKAFAEGFKRVCLQAPTGMGKTVVATHLIKAAIRDGKRVMFIVHLKELIEQTAAASTEAALTYGYISAVYPYTRNKPLYLASTQTLVKRFQKLPKPDLILYDEFHHAVSATSLKVLEYYKDVPLVGLTATPQRLDGKGLIKVADKLITTISTRELIEQGFLCNYEYYAPDSGINYDDIHKVAGDFNPKELDDALEKTTIFGKAVEHYKKYIDGEPAICFCLNIKHSIRMAQQFKAAGIEAAHIDGKMSAQERHLANIGFKTGRIKVLCNVNLITEGYDVPACKGIFLLRPTDSLTIFLQSVGRGLRRNWDIPQEKDCCYIFDHVENYKRHGMPDEDREWSLEGRVKNKNKIDEKLIKIVICSNCAFGYRPNKHKVCPKCAAMEMSNTKDVEETSHELVQVKNYVRPEKYSASEIKKMKQKCRTKEDLKDLEKKLGYKTNWAQHQMEIREQWKSRFSRLKKR